MIAEDQEDCNSTNNASKYITLKIHPSIPTIMFRLTRVEGLKPVIQRERVRENENHIVKYDIHDLDQMLKCDNTLV